VNIDNGRGRKVAPDAWHYKGFTEAGKSSKQAGQSDGYEEKSFVFRRSEVQWQLVGPLKIVKRE
jgi:hypothetical protein